MDRGDIEFSVSLNTSPAERQLDLLYEKMRTPGVSNHAEPLLQQVANEYKQGFKMVGGVYDTGSNHFGVPSTKVLETALVVTAQSFQKFNDVIKNVIQLSNAAVDSYFRQISQPRIGYTPNTLSPFRTNAYARLQTIGSPLSKDFSLSGNTYDGYITGGNNYDVPSTIVSSGGLIRGNPRVSAWSPSEFYTREEVNAINNPEAVFNYLVNKRREGEKYSSVYDTFSRINSVQGMYSYFNNTFGKDYDATRSVIGLPPSKEENKTLPWHEKHLAEVNKKDNIELKEKFLLWSKILATIYAVKKVLEGLVKAWQFGADTATSRNTNINEEVGYFSTDPVGAMRANVDKTRSMLYAGVRNMGANTPVSKEGLDYFSSKITDMWTSAMAGRNVDARTTIDIQRLKDFFGIDLSVAGLLTGQREGKTATDVQLDVLKKVETQLQKLNEADEITKGQVIDSLKNVLGEEMIDAIVSNYNKNIKLELGDRLTVAERLISAGGSALSPQDLTAKTTSAVTALTEFHTALETLKNTITVTFAPAFVSVTNTLTDFINWLNRKMTHTTGDKQADVVFEGIGSAQSEPGTIGSYTNSGENFGTWGERNTKASNLIKGAKNANDVLNAVALLNPLVIDEGSAEDLRKRRLTREAGEAIISGKLDPNSNNPIIQKLAKYSYGGKTGIEAIRLAASQGIINVQGKGMLQDLLYSPEEFEEKTIEDFLPRKYDSYSDEKKAKALKNAETKLEKYNAKKNSKKFGAVNQLRSTDFMGQILLDLFGEGGALDYNPSSEEFYDYVLDPYSYETADDYYNAIQQLKESFDKNRWGREYISSFDLPKKEDLWGSDKTLDFGEVKFKIVLTDEKGTTLENRDVTGTVNSLVQ